jgi:hypothetical protein
MLFLNLAGSFSNLAFLSDRSGIPEGGIAGRIVPIITNSDKSA